MRDMIAVTLYIYNIMYSYLIVKYILIFRFAKTMNDWKVWCRREK